jgi:catechol 2,3-dioxygenase-like lactoylglutathione lyase family enzyme
MPQTIAQVSLLVKEYDEAIDFYVSKLGFTLLEDTRLSETKRWVVVGPANPNGCRLLLAKADKEEQISRVGNQTGGRVFLFLYTDDFPGTYKRLEQQSIKIVRQPTAAVYGTVAVFEDLYGNLWDLIGPATPDSVG